MKEPTISVRQHWMALVRGDLIISVLASIALLLAYKNPVWVVHTFDITKSMDGFQYVKLFYDRGWLFVLLPLGYAAFSLLMSWSWWSISFFNVDEFALTYKLGPFMENQIPLRAIQDIRMSRGILGVTFGFGDVIVDAGRQEEKLKYVPDVERIVNALRPQRF